MKYTYTLLTPSNPTLSNIKKYTSLEISLQKKLKGLSIANARQYNAILKRIYTLSRNITSTKRSVSFRNELAGITKKLPLTEKVPWGGVALKKVDVEKDFIQKLLIIKKGGVLGFEIHKKKKEHLKVLEGYCIVFFINRFDKPNNAISLQLAGPGDEYTFQPKDEHGILALTDSIIEETSTNHLDDLVYIFNAHL